MKKVITALFTAMLVVVLAFALSGCSKANKIKKAYEGIIHNILKGNPLATLINKLNYS